MKNIAICGLGIAAHIGHMASLQAPQKPKIALVTSGNPQDLTVIEEATRLLGDTYEIHTITNSEIRETMESGKFLHTIKLNACEDLNIPYSIHQASKIAEKVEQCIPDVAYVKDTNYPTGQEGRRLRRQKQRQRIRY